MFVGSVGWMLVWMWLCLIIPSFVEAQDDILHFTSGVTNPAPVPGQPFTLTWSGGNPSEPVYIVLTYLFPFTPNQDIPYGRTDILSNAPNNGSWTYDVPATIVSGRYTFSIGVNPLLLSDTTASFTIETTQTEYIPPYPSPTTTGSSWSYNGCGLIPLPDYTYTGYQAPCAVTIDGHVETIYPIVPASLSSSFYGSEGIFKTNTELASLVSDPSESTSSYTADPPQTTSINTAFATGVYAQALQCTTSVTATLLSVTQSNTATVYSSVGCPDASAMGSSSQGICHSSGYTTFSVDETTSVCCPTGWSTTPLLSSLYCFTSASRRSLWDRQTPPETETFVPAAIISVHDLALTAAGIVRNDATPAGNVGGAAQTSADSNVAGKLGTGGARPCFLMIPLAAMLYMSPWQ